MDAGRLGRGDHRVRRRLGVEAGDVLRRRCRRTAPCPAAGSRYAGPRASADHWSRAAPSIRILPWAAGQTPTMARASEDFPDALGPITPSPWPALSWKATPWTTSRLVPGGLTLTRFERERRGGLRQLHARLVGRQHAEQAIEAPPALARRDEAAPVGDRHLDRRQRARRQDRARDDDAGRGLLVDHEIGADARAPPTAAPCAGRAKARPCRR